MLPEKAAGSEAEAGAEAEEGAEVAEVMDGEGRRSTAAGANGKGPVRSGFCSKPSTGPFCMLAEGG